ncbi:hypothetical protein CVT25_010555 [Psilocybe cyanescens]|uniref:Secreted protein n=1 Tax=Psilocybe cyanescens TaxID=93625 RepID=A0A409WJI6_PSICY|nr:hypothetical protein CVT25_010555 [Psilocybe cyanescens]
MRSFPIIFTIFAHATGMGVSALWLRDAPTVLTAERIFHTVIKESPFIVERTSTVTWTLAPSTAAATATATSSS